MLFLLCGLYCRAFRVESCLALCSRGFFSVLLGVVVASIWESWAGLCAFRAFVCLFCTH